LISRILKSEAKRGNQSFLTFKEKALVSNTEMTTNVGKKEERREKKIKREKDREKR